ncbi:hypothetical protein DS66_01550 [Mesotoga sp. SC_3PWM13N19]|nr:hypothetical protein DS66_01550 [Mesotoga sp. SC_3PWM13N19]
MSDSEGASSSGSFEITVIDVNRQPSIPFDPVPKMAETSVPTNTSLSWSCEDLDGDSLLYDVYLGKTPNLSLLLQEFPERLISRFTLRREPAIIGRSLLQTVKTKQRAPYGNSPP